MSDAATAFRALDPLKLPIAGNRLIEASAGTGKTWTLAALYVRLVLGHGRSDTQGLMPSQILVMTFTDAAVAELRERIRARLQAACRGRADARRRAGRQRGVRRIRAVRRPPVPARHRMA